MSKNGAEPAANKGANANQGKSAASSSSSGSRDSRELSQTTASAAGGQEGVEVRFFLWDMLKKNVRLMYNGFKYELRGMNEMTAEWKVDPVHPDSASIESAAKLLREGQLVAFPTETVYGLGADATSTEAVRRIFDAKGRPSDNPLIVHIADRAQLEG